jgi:hypothetical protein
MPQPEFLKVAEQVSGNHTLPIGSLVVRLQYNPRARRSPRPKTPTRKLSPKDELKSSPRVGTPKPGNPNYKDKMRNLNTNRYITGGNGN